MYWGEWGWCETGDTINSALKASIQITAMKYDYQLFELM
jgi:hypothetical protein